MRRAFVLIGLVCSLAVAMDFATFEQRAINSFPKLLQQKKSIEIAKERSSKLLRPLNAELEILASSYEEGSGFEATLQIPWRLPHFFKDLRARAMSEVEIQRAYHTILKAQFRKNLELLYTRYVYQVRSLQPIRSEIAIYKRLLSIAKERYAKGFGKRIELLKLQTRLHLLQKSLIDGQRDVADALMKLKRYAGLDSDVEARGFLYSAFDLRGSINPPEIAWYEKQRVRYGLLAKEHGHTIKNLRFVFNYEKEPGSRILRGGISLPLPLFKPKQEIAIAKMRASSMALEMELLKKRYRIAFEGLKKQASLLQKSLRLLLQTKKEQERLLELYIESYKIDKSTLLAILDAQKALIATQKELLQKRLLLNAIQIELNYIKGRYNG